MIIDRIELYLVRNQFLAPWRTAYGTDYENNVLITRMISGEHEGWSESSPLPGPHYCSEYGEGAFQVASRFLAPVLVGKDITSGQEIMNLLGDVKGNSFAKAGVEMAWWTLKAEMEGVPLRRLLGQTEGTPVVDRGSAVGIKDSFDDLIAEIGEDLDHGAKRVKLKAAHGWDLDMVAAVRSVFPHQKFHIDCNSSYTYEEADLFKKLDKYHLEMIEQPFAPGDLVSHGKLQKQLDTPLCLDESISDPLCCRQALELGACRYVNIKPARVGGLTNSLAINKMCKDAGVGCWVGGLLESDIGKAVCLELASIPNMVYPHDIAIETTTYIDPLGDIQLEHCAPFKLKTSERSGSPVKPNMEKLLAKTEQKIIIEGK